ncbi:kelch-like protein 9 [Branchiostoma floridae]|uniref:Kelch-like protein 9 n=1 Tax=Branchiostoma floridae TaxID=7739 RepID=A0A9J7MIF0_BRAFL|nr:kelch-like protein 9 [Branchiostoma floridae]
MGNKVQPLPEPCKVCAHPPDHHPEMRDQMVDTSELERELNEQKKASQVSDKLRALKQEKARAANSKSSQQNSPNKQLIHPHCCQDEQGANPMVKSRDFKSSEHGDSLLFHLNRLRRDNHYCDTYVTTDEGGFRVHQAVLAAISPRFKEEMELQAAEQEQKQLTTIRIKDVSPTALNFLLDFAYTSEISINLKHVEDIFKSAKKLAIPGVVFFCKEFLSQEINMDNCLKVLEVAGRCDLHDIVEKVDGFIQKNFDLMSESDLLQQLTYQQISSYMRSDDVRSSAELKLFNAAWRWLKYDSSRSAHAHDLMADIRFGLMSSLELKNHVQQVDFMRTDQQCSRTLQEAYEYHLFPSLQPLRQNITTKVRSSTYYVITVGGAQKEPTNQCLYLDLSPEPAFSDGVMPRPEWKQFQRAPKARYQLTAAVLNNFVYLVGGQNEVHAAGRAAENSGWRYDPRSNEWLFIAPMHEQRTEFCLCAVGDTLLAVGGRNTSGLLKSVEKYDMERDTWSYVSSLKNPVCGHAGSVSCDKVYVSGGYTGQDYDKSMLSYSRSSDQWDVKRPMFSARAWHCLVTFDDNMYAIGGHRRNPAGWHEDINVVEMYQTSANQWTKVTSMDYPRSFAGSCVVNNAVYVVGGVSKQSQSCMRIVQRYFPEEDRWERLPDLPSPSNGTVCATMALSWRVVNQSHAIYPPSRAVSSTSVRDSSKNISLTINEQNNADNRSALSPVGQTTKLSLASVAKQSNLKEQGMDKTSVEMGELI